MRILFEFLVNCRGGVEIAFVEHDHCVHGRAGSRAEIAVDEEEIRRRQRPTTTASWLRLAASGSLRPAQCAAAKKTVACQNRFYQQFFAFVATLHAIAADDFQVPANGARHAVRARCIPQQQVSSIRAMTSAIMAI